jgi:hypothetical protein
MKFQLGKLIPFRYKKAGRIARAWFDKGVEDHVDAPSPETPRPSEKTSREQGVVNPPQTHVTTSTFRIVGGACCAVISLRGGESSNARSSPFRGFAGKSATNILPSLEGSSNLILFRAMSQYGRR